LQVIVPAPDIDALADLGVAEVGEVWRLRAFPQARVLELHEVADLGPLADLAAGPQLREGSDHGARADLRFAQQAVVEHLRTRTDLRVHDPHERTEHGARLDRGLALQKRGRPQHSVRRDLHGAPDPRALRILDHDAGGHQLLQPAPAQQPIDRGQFLQRIDSEGPRLRPRP
jgi:hypothetical protein